MSKLHSLPSSRSSQVGWKQTPNISPRIDKGHGDHGDHGDMWPGRLVASEHPYPSAIPSSLTWHLLCARCCSKISTSICFFMAHTWRQCWYVVVPTSQKGTPGPSWGFGYSYDMFLCDGFLPEH